MNNKRNFYGQINYTKLLEAMKSGKVAGKRIDTRHGKQVVVDINVWVNDQRDQYGQDASIQCQLNEEAWKSKEKNPFYIGNLRYQESKSTDLTPGQIAGMAEDAEDDLPF